MNKRTCTKCGGRIIPIATTCDPPEPTVIDESDLAPGMVVVAVDDDRNPLDAWLTTPDAALNGNGLVCMLDGFYLADLKHEQSSSWVERVAGRGRPC